MKNTESSPWGWNQLMATAAVRYCLGRRTYIVSVCAEWLLDQWENFDQSTRDIIVRDIEEAFLQDNNFREQGSGMRALGDDMDRECWTRAIKEIRAKNGE